MNSPIKAALRAERRFARLDSRTPCCIVCGETDPACLLLKRGHHLTGHKRDSTLWIVICKNCHAKAHARLANKGVPMVREQDKRKRLKMRLKALSDFLDQLAESLNDWSEEL